jgi:chloride channel protein, CIC family
VGGLLLGLLLVALPQMYGVGYPVLGAAVAGTYGVALLVLLLVGKLVATSLTLAIGGSGGIFAPSLFLGAMAGTALGDGAGLLGATGPVGAYGLVGMAAVLAGATRAPFTAVVIVAEITGSWSMAVPLMLGVVIATAGSRLLGPDTIYTLKLRRRGIVLHPPGTPAWARRTAAEAARPDGPGLDGVARERGPLRWAPVLAGEQPLLEATDALVRAGRPLPVLSVDGRRLAGVLHPVDVVADPDAPSATPSVPDDRTEPDPVDPDPGADDRCVVELRAPLPDGWAPPDGFARLDDDGTGYPTLVGPRAGLDALAAHLPPPGDRPPNGEAPS